MKKERKEELLHCFPSVPRNIENQMQGRGAMNFCVFLTYGHELFARCYHRYTHGELVERQRYVFAKDGAVRYIYDEYEFNAWRVATKFREPRFAARGYPYAFDNTYVILNADAYKQSDMKYSQEGGFNMCCPMLYLRLYVRNPNIEYLVKAGYWHLIEESKDYYVGNFSVKVNHHVNLKSNNLLKMLGLNREEFRLLRGWEKRYENYIRYREELPQYSPRELMEITEAYGYAHRELGLQALKSGLSPLRMARYLNANNLEPGLYGDYIDQCCRLHYNFADTSVSFPKDFYAMHERLSELIKIRADEKTRRLFTKNYDGRRDFAYAEEDLFIRQPKSIEEIVNEGKVLHHCVGGYAERHAKGITNILFIRRKSEPYRPFYTVEIDNSGNIIQRYGMRNCPANDEIKQFEKRYLQYLQEGKFNDKRIKSELQ